MRSRLHPQGALCAVGGPVVIGTIVGMPSGPFAAGHGALATPAILFGVTALMVPALYIATAFAGVAPPARRFAGAIGDGLRVCGVALLGLAAPAGFLAATSETAAAASLAGAGALVASVLIGLRGLHRRLFADRSPDLVHLAIYGGWSLLAMTLGLVFWDRGMAGLAG